MENASKALLIAGGILLTMLILMVLIFYRQRIVEFYDSQEKIDDIANISEFNKQFTNFERNNVYGYDLISLANMIEDYNNRHSNAEDAKNDENYNPITLMISFKDKWSDVEKNIWYDSSYSNHLFMPNMKEIKQSEVKNEIVSIIQKQENCIKIYGSTDKANKLAKSIKALIIDENEDASQISNLMNTQRISKNDAIKVLKQQAVDDYKAIVKSNENLNYDSMVIKLTSTANIYQYYEYNQFKKAKFNCTKVEYYNGEGESGRIKELDFEFTGNVE